MLSPIVLMTLVLGVLGLVFFFVMVISKGRQYKYKIIIHKNDGDKIVPVEEHRAKIETITDIKSGYNIIFKTNKGKKIPAVNIEKNRVVAGKLIDYIVNVYTPDDVQYFPMKIAKVGEDMKYVPDFDKNAMAISGAINTIRYAKMLASKFWSQFLQVAIPVFMVFILVGGAIMMFVYASDYSKNIKEASYVIANASNRMTEISSQMLKLNEKIYNSSTGKIPIEPVKLPANASSGAVSGG